MRNPASTPDPLDGLINLIAQIEVEKYLKEVNAGEIKSYHTGAHDESSDIRAL